jgi:hypothetical protein
MGNAGLQNCYFEVFFETSEETLNDLKEEAVRDAVGPI